MTKILLPLIIIAAGPLVVVAQTKIPSDLKQILETSKPPSKVRVIAAMSAKCAFKPYSVTVSDQRDYIVRERLAELRKFSSADQVSIIAFLDKARGAAKADDIKSNLVKNYVSFRGDPEIIYEVAARDDVSFVFPFDEKKFADESVSPADLNVVDYMKDFRTNIDRLSDANSLVRRNAILYLAREKNAESLAAILGVLYDEDVYVRRTAVEAMANFAGFRAAETAVIEFMKKENDVSAKIAAIRSAGDLKSAAAAETLKALARDPYPIYRAEAVKALGKINPPSAYPIIVSAISDEAEGVRIAAMEVSARLRLRIALSPSIIMLSDATPLVRRAACVSIGQIGGPSEIEILETLAATDPENYVRVEAANSAELIRSRSRQR